MLHHLVAHQSLLPASLLAAAASATLAQLSSSKQAGTASSVSGRSPRCARQKLLDSTGVFQRAAEPCRGARRFGGNWARCRAMLCTARWLTGKRGDRTASVGQSVARWGACCAATRRDPPCRPSTAASEHDHGFFGDTQSMPAHARKVCMQVARARARRGPALGSRIVDLHTQNTHPDGGHG